jgi:hypothetical protein
LAVAQRETQQRGAIGSTDAILRSVSGENAEIVRRWVTPALSRNLDEVRASVTEFFDPDFDYYPARKFPEARPCHGLEEFARFLTSFREPLLVLARCRSLVESARGFCSSSAAIVSMTASRAPPLVLRAGASARSALPLATSRETI